MKKKKLPTYAPLSPPSSLSFLLCLSETRQVKEVAQVKLL